MLTYTRFVAVTVLVGALIGAGCSSSADPESAETCGELGDIAVEVTQDYIDTLEAADVTIDVFDTPPESESESPVSEETMAKFATTAEAIRQRWSDLECEGDISKVIGERADELTYTKRIGEYIVSNYADLG